MGTKNYRFFTMNKLILTSIPRSGSTWLFRSLCGLPQGSTTQKNPFIRQGWELHKTHLPFHYWENKITENDKIIFVYGDVIDSVISTKLNRNEPNHYKNCGYIGDLTNKDIFKEDFANYELIFDSWINCKKNRLCIRYENFNEQRLYGYVPFKFTLLPRKNRTNNRTNKQRLKQ